MYNKGMENGVEKIIAQNLIDLRKYKNLKQSELSKKIGYSDKTISRWENGTTVPDISTLVKLAEFYGVTLEEIIHENAVQKYQENTRKKSQEEVINFYSLLGLGVLTIWAVAVMVHIGLIMIQKSNFWQVYILAVPASCLLVYRYSRKNHDIKWFNFLVLSLTVITTVLFFYLAYLHYNFWQLFILIAPLEGISAISSFFPKRASRFRKNRKQKESETEN